MDRLLTVEKVARLLGVKRSTLYTWANEGRIPSMRLGRLIRFRERKIETWLQRKEIKSRKPRVS